MKIVKFYAGKCLRTGWCILENNGLRLVGAHHFGNIPALGCITLGVKRYANFACDIIQVHRAEGFSFIVHQAFQKKHKACCSRHFASLFFFSSFFPMMPTRYHYNKKKFIKIGAGLYAYILFRNNLNEFWDFYHGTKAGAG
jgi:hypothetical protein